MNYGLLSKPDFKEWFTQAYEGKSFYSVTKPDLILLKEYHVYLVDNKFIEPDHDLEMLADEFFDNFDKWFSIFESSS